MRLWSTMKRKCVNGHEYYEIDNVGHWQCKQHAMEYEEEHGLWPCCGKTQFSNLGCVSADHRCFGKPFEVSDTIYDVPQPISRLMGPRKGDLGNGAYLRFDRQAQNRIRSDPAHSHDIVLVETAPGEEEELLFPFEHNTTVVFPSARCFDLGPELLQNTEELLLWDGEKTFVKIKAIIPEQLGLFILSKTDRTLCLKLADVRTVPIETREGIPGVQYKRSFVTNQTQWTPLSEVTLF
jgi:hypothetical protein